MTTQASYIPPAGHEHMTCAACEEPMVEHDRVDVLGVVRLVCRTPRGNHMDETASGDPHG